MNKKIWWIVGIVIVVVVIIIASHGAGSSSTGPIKIGVSLPLTGNLAFIGETDRNAALLAMDEINSRTDLKNKYELVMDDDSFDAQKAANVINKFISIDKVNAVISIGSTAGNAIAPVTEADKIPFIGMASDPNVAKGEYNFIDWTRPQEEVTAMVQEMQERNINKVAIIGANQQGFKAIADDFVKKAAAAGITIVGNETFNSGQTDFKTVILKLSALNPQIYLLGAFDPEIGIIGKQMHDLGVKTPLTSVESFGLTADATPFEGDWYVDSATPTSAFSSAYQAKYGKAPGPAAANVYDAIHLFVNAFESASVNGTPTSDKVVQALETVKDYPGALGVLSVNADREFMSPATVMVITHGKPVPEK